MVVYRSALLSRRPTSRYSPLRNFTSHPRSISQPVHECARGWVKRIQFHIFCHQGYAVVCLVDKPGLYVSRLLLLTYILRCFGKTLILSSVVWLSSLYSAFCRCRLVQSYFSCCPVGHRGFDLYAGSCICIGIWIARLFAASSGVCKVACDRTAGCSLWRF